MIETNKLINPLTGREWDLNSLIEKLMEVQEALFVAQEHNVSLTAQARELERAARDVEDIKIDHDNQAQLLVDKAKENKYLQQELSRIATTLNNKLQEIEDLKTQITELQHQLKTCQSERDLLAIMLTDAENTAKQMAHKREENNAKGKESQMGWLRHLKGKPNS